MNTKKRNLGFVRVAGTVLLAALVLTTSIWFTRAQLAKQSGVNTASVYSGGYSIPVLVSTSLTPVPETNTDRTEIRCRVLATDTNRIDPAKHPTLHRMLNGDDGYCGIYSYLLSLYHTFGIREIATEKGKMPIASNKTDMNLDLIEWYVKNNPGMRNGVSNTDIAALYRSVGKSCIVVKYDEDQLEKQCKDLKAYKAAGYDCDLGVYGSGIAHSMNIKSVSWSNSKKTCVQKVRSTTDQYDPKINPGTHTVNISFFKKGYVPDVDYIEDDRYSEGADYICCK